MGTLLLNTHFLAAGGFRNLPFIHKEIKKDMSLTAIFEEKLRTYAADGKEAPSFHNEKRLRESLAAVEETGLPAPGKELAQAAVWLYFLGFYENPGNPLKGSESLAVNEEALKNTMSLEVLALLQTTDKNEAPANAVEAAFRDAATIYFASPKFFKRLDGLKKEVEKAAGQKTSKEAWYCAQLKKMEAHRYFTNTGKTVWEPVKMQNVSALQKEVKKLDKQLDSALMQELQVDAGQLKSLKKKLSKAKGAPDRGIETWFRTASGNLYTRRQIVDTKSNIMITMNAIIISVMLGNVYPQLNDNPTLLWAITPLVLTNLLSIAFAIFATRPVLANGVFTKEQVLEKKARLTTFDDFYQVPLPDYEWAVGKMLQDREFLYNTLIRDMHRLGVDLAVRYKNIRLSYHVFLTGLIISLLAFGSCYILG